MFFLHYQQGEYLEESVSLSLYNALTLIARSGHFSKDKQKWFIIYFIVEKNQKNLEPQVRQGE